MLKAQKPYLIAGAVVENGNAECSVGEDALVPVHHGHGVHHGLVVLELFLTLYVSRAESG